jgi:hypothetical protein
MIENRISGIVGRKGTGKTYRMARMFCNEKRALLYQPVRVNTEADECASHISEGDSESIYNILDTQEQFRIIYKVPDIDILVVRNHLIYKSVLPIVWACYNTGNMTLYLDEAHELCNQYTIDPELRRILRLARNNRLNVVWIAQSMEVHRELRRGTDEFYFLRITEPGDLEKIAERCGEITANRIAQLKRLRRDGERITPGECLFWSADNV